MADPLALLEMVSLQSNRFSTKNAFHEPKADNDTRQLITDLICLNCLWL